jgi:hypothetical protein
MQWSTWALSSHLVTPSQLLISGTSPPPDPHPHTARAALHTTGVAPGGEGGEGGGSAPIFCVLGVVRGGQKSALEKALSGAALRALLFILQVIIIVSIRSIVIIFRGLRPIIRNPEKKKLLTLLGSFTRTSSIITVGINDNASCYIFVLLLIIGRAPVCRYYTT